MVNWEYRKEARRAWGQKPLRSQAILAQGLSRAGRVGAHTWVEWIPTPRAGGFRGRNQNVGGMRGSSGGLEGGGMPLWVGSTEAGEGETVCCDGGGQLKGEEPPGKVAGLGAGSG